jgi:hypothetical protein
MTDNYEPPAADQADDLWLIDRILAGETGPEQAPLAQLFEAASAPARPDELSGLDPAVAAFVELGPGAARAPKHSRARRNPVLSALTASKLAGVVAVGGIALASTVTAAYAGALPDGLQNFAHHTIGARAADDSTSGDADQPGGDGDSAGGETSSPTATPTSSPTDTPTATPTSSRTPVGPNATGSPAFGLCTAWSHHGLATVSVAYQSLATAAGGTDGIAAYCATVVHPGNSTGSPTSHPGGSPTSHPGGSPTSHPGGSPTSHPGGSPTGHPKH